MKQTRFRNIAFISYKREDESWAKWLQKKLEHYKLPTEIRKKYPSLEFSESPRYVFKDTTDLSGGVLAKAIKAGLDSSKFLIVICSPRAAKSEWVCKEVQDFINSGREEYIIPFIIDGEPHSNDVDKECFPEVLRLLAGERELLGININENGREAAAVKVVSRMFEISFDVLWQRFKRERKKKRTEIWVALFVIIISLIGLVFYVRFKNAQFEKSNIMMAQNRGRYVLKEAMDLIRDGDIYTAQRLCRDLIIHGDTDVQIKPEIEKVLYAAEDSLNVPYKQIAIFKEHSQTVKKVCFSPDAQLIASRDKDSKVIIRKTCSGEIVCTIDSTCSMLDDNNIDFSPNGKEILLSGSDLSSFNPRTGKQIKIIDKWGENAKYNKVGDKIFYTQSGNAYIFDLKENKKNRIFTEEKGERCIMGVFSPIDNNLAIILKKGWIDSKYYLCQIDEHGKIIRKFLVSERSIEGIAYSPNGQKVATVSTDGKAKVWHMQTGKLLSVFDKTNDYVTSVKFDNTGKFAISTGFKNIYIWNPVDGTLIAELKGHSRLTNDADVSHDGRFLVSCSLDNSVRLWTLKSNPRKSNFKNIVSNCEHIVEWIPNNDTTKILYGDGYKYSIYDVKRSQVRHSAYKGLGTSPIFTDNEKCFIRVCTDGYIRKWSINSGNLVDSVKIKDSKIASDFVWWYRSSKLGSNYAYISGKTKTYKFDMKNSTLSPIYDKRILYFDKENNRAAIADDKHNIVIINLNKDSLFSIKQKSLYALDFSHNGKFIATSERESKYSIFIWNADSGDNLFENADSKTWVYYCKFSNDSKHLVSGGGAMESEMRIWDTDSWTCILQKNFQKPAGPFFWINNDKSILLNTNNAICQFDLPNYNDIVNRLNILFGNLELSDSERKLYFIER